MPNLGWIRIPADFAGMPAVDGVGQYYYTFPEDAPLNKLEGGGFALKWSVVYSQQPRGPRSHISVSQLQPAGFPQNTFHITVNLLIKDSDLVQSLHLFYDSDGVFYDSDVKSLFGKVSVGMLPAIRGVTDPIALLFSQTLEFSAGEPRSTG